jgi:hypothetical protein
VSRCTRCHGKGNRSSLACPRREAVRRSDRLQPLAILSGGALLFCFDGMPIEQGSGERRRARPSARKALQQRLRRGPVDFRERSQRLCVLNVAVFVFRLVRQREQLAEEKFAVEQQPVAHFLAPIFVEAIRGRTVIDPKNRTKWFNFLRSFDPGGGN